MAHRYLRLSPVLDSYDKRNLEALLNLTYENTPTNRFVVAKSVEVLLALLAKHFGRPAVLLIDEYDVPLANAASDGYYDEMYGLIDSLLDVLKPEGIQLDDGRPCLGKAVLTGCLRVSPRSMITGFNNLSVDSVCSDGEPYGSAIGFTDAEVGELLSYYGVSALREDVRKRYGGYRFGSQNIYCPWNVLNFCRNASFVGSDRQAEKLQSYWMETSGNEVIDEFLGLLTTEDADRMRVLIDGGAVGLN